MKISVVSKILEANDKLAAENRKVLDTTGTYAINLMSAPGAGKTTLLTRTIKALGDSLRVGVIEGDIQGTYDAEVIGALDVAVTQINTGGACHLDASMINDAMKELPLGEIDLMVIENVGNLVCPAEFNVGEHMKVMLLSLTEGHDKPLKYPLMFQESSALVINKMDLAPYVDADPEKIRKDALSLNPSLKIFETSCSTGDGIGKWVDWLREIHALHKKNIEAAR
ncbi:hydrogenase nickel incorporation protein HypB [Nitrospirota bacterium]